MTKIWVFSLKGIKNIVHIQSLAHRTGSRKFVGKISNRYIAKFLFQRMNELNQNTSL